MTRDICTWTNTSKAETSDPVSWDSWKNPQSEWCIYWFGGTIHPFFSGHNTSNEIWVNTERKILHISSSDSNSKMRNSMKYSFSRICHMSQSQINKDFSCKKVSCDVTPYKFFPLGYLYQMSMPPNKSKSYCWTEKSNPLHHRPNWSNALHRRLRNFFSKEPDSEASAWVVKWSTTFSIKIMST